MRVHHLVDSVFDRCTLLVMDSVPQRVQKRSRFHFEAMWSKKEDCKSIISEVWESGVELNTPNGVAVGLKQCADKLTRWNKTTFGQVLRQIQNRRKALCEMVRRDRDGSLGREINKMRKEINDLLDSEEILWQQRAKVQWLTSKGL